MVVLFDIDDTLFDHRTAERAGAIALHRSVNAQVTVEQFVSAWATALDRAFARYLAGEVNFQGQRRERIKEVVDPSLPDEAADEIFAGYIAAYEAAWSLFSDVPACLDRLSHCRLGIVSNGHTQQQLQKLKRTGIEDRFACTVISEECGWHKPSREIFLEACRRMDASPADAVYVGDGYDVDAEAARHAGLTGVWLDRRQQRTAIHQSPVISTLDELAGLLRG